MSNRTTGRIVGVLFLAAFLCYGVGSAIVDRPFGPALMLLNSVVVAAIGVLVFRVLRRQHLRTAATYLTARALEAALLAVGVLLLVGMGSVEGNNLAYQFAMLILGISSVPLCRALLRDRFVPGWAGHLGHCGVRRACCRRVAGTGRSGGGSCARDPRRTLRGRSRPDLDGARLPRTGRHTGGDSAARGQRSDRCQRMRTISSDASMRRSGLIGWLAFTSGFVPRVIGVLVAVAGAGYLIDSLGGLLSATYTFELASLTFIGEVVLMVWLLVFAARRPPNERTTSDDHRLAGVSDPTTIRSSGPESRS